MLEINTLWTGLVLCCSSTLSRHEIEQGVMDASGKRLALDPDIQQVIQEEVLSKLHDLDIEEAYSFTWKKECHPEHIHPAWHSGACVRDISYRGDSELCQKFRDGLFQKIQNNTIPGRNLMHRSWILADLIRAREAKCCLWCRVTWVRHLRRGREEAWRRITDKLMVTGECIGITK